MVPTAQLTHLSMQCTCIHSRPQAHFRTCAPPQRNPYPRHGLLSCPSPPGPQASLIHRPPPGTCLSANSQEPSCSPSHCSPDLLPRRSGEDPSPALPHPREVTAECLRSGPGRAASMEPSSVLEAPAREPPLVCPPLATTYVSRP